MYFSLAAGLLVLTLCGDLLVRGAAGLAERAGLSPLIIALTVVSLGTSMPELFISVSAALRGSPDIALGNVVGSNIANILLVLGIPAMLYPIACSHHALRLNTGFMLAASGLLIVFCLVGPLTRGEGEFLLVALVAYLAWSAWDAKRYPADAIVQTAETITLVKHMPRATIAGFILVGCIGLPVGAHFVVEGGTLMARSFGVSEAVIALTLIAVGTSLPELATSLMAAIRRKHDVAIGNVIGSNIINILAILGVTSLIMPLPVAPNFLQLDLWVMLLAAFAIVPTVIARGTISRSMGAFFVVAYIAYVYAIFQNAGEMI
tara:strand:- start:5727 stop:6683 length:957 start_codon:yes stop_codon:yes gene_type:complete